MQRLVLACLAALAAAPASVAVAQRAGAPPAAQASLKIAFVSYREILQRTPGYAAAESTYRKELDGFRVEVERLQQQLDSALQAFDQQSIVLSPAARRARQDSLQAMQQRMGRRTSELQERAQLRERELLQPIQARVNSIIEGIRAEGNYAVVLNADSDFIVAADPTLNITARVLQRLQQAQ